MTTPEAISKLNSLAWTIEDNGSCVLREVWAPILRSIAGKLEQADVPACTTPTDLIEKLEARIQVLEELVEFCDTHYAVSEDVARAAQAKEELPLLRSTITALQQAQEDTRRLDRLEELANERGGILLHDGSETGRTGIGLRPGNLVRTLRQAIDATTPAREEGEG